MWERLILSDTDGDAFEALLRRWEPLHDQRVVARNYVRRGIGEGTHEVEGAVHPCQVGHDAERTVLLDVGVEVCRVGGEDDVAPDGLYPHHLQSRRVPAGLVHLDAG